MKNIHANTNAVNTPQTIFRNASPRGHTALCNLLLQCRSVSLECIGFMAAMLSLPAGWIFHFEWALQHFGIGETKLKRLIREAKSAGFMKVEACREDGRFTGLTTYYFTDTPGQFTVGEETAPAVDFTVGGKTPHVGKSPPYKKKTQKIETETNSPPTPPWGADGTDVPLASGADGDLSYLDEMSDDEFNEMHAESPVSRQPEQGYLFPQNLAPERPSESGSGNNTPKASASHKASSRPRRASAGKKPLYTDEFEEFWKAYPNKKGKAVSADIWSRLSAADRKAAVEALPRYKVSRDVKRGFIRHGSTYLAQHTWDDYPEGSSDIPGTTWRISTPEERASADRYDQQLRDIMADCEERELMAAIEAARAETAKRGAEGNAVFSV